MSALLDITGERFCRWTVLRYSHSEVNGSGKTAHWTCRCDCGAERTVNGSNLRRGLTTSCGCRNREVIGFRTRTHGLSGSSEYNIWQKMWQRCTDASCNSYRNYGARGITVCERWRIFENFFSDMGPRPFSSHSIDRFPDNDGNYEPGNCRWASPYEQGSNTRANVRITFVGKTLTLSEWARSLNIQVGTLWHRIQKAHWAVDRALTQPLRRTVHADNSPL